MDPNRRSRRQAELRRIDAWLLRLRDERPALYFVLVFAAALGVVGLTALLRVLLFRW